MAVNPPGPTAIERRWAQGNRLVRRRLEGAVLALGIERKVQRGDADGGTLRERRCLEPTAAWIGGWGARPMHERDV